MKRGETSKSYYLPPWRSITIGIILVIVGLTFTFFGVDLHNSLWDNIQSVLISFNDMGDFLASLLMLAFKSGFLLGGYFFIKYADGVEAPDSMMKDFMSSILYVAQIQAAFL